MTEAEHQALVKLAEQVEGPMTAFTSTQLAINIVLAYGLKYLWNVINLLQFVIYFQKWNVNIDPEANVFIDQIRSLALFEFFDTKFATDWIRNGFRVINSNNLNEDLEDEYCKEDDPECFGE